MGEYILNRRELLAAILSVPMLTCQAPKHLISTEIVGTRGITIMGRYWRERRWDCFHRFYDVIKTTYPDINLDDLIHKINNVMSHEENRIHFIEVTNGWNGHYVHFKYIDSEEALAVPVSCS